MTLDWFALLLRMQADPGDYIPDQVQITPPELFLSHSRAPGSTAFTVPTLNTTYCELSTLSLNKQILSLDIPTPFFFDDGQFFLSIYCKGSM
jgi:hypothetical protein